MLECLTLAIVADHFLAETEGAVDGQGQFMGLEQRISRESYDGRFIDHDAALMQETVARELERTRQPLLPVITGGANRLAATEPAAAEQSRQSIWKSRRIAVKAKGRIHLLDPARILAAEAQSNYVLLQQIVESYLLREQISVLAEKLEPFGFIRIHRSVLVNAALVEELEPLLTGAYLLRMRGGKEYSVTRTYKRNLQMLARSWIGMDGLFAD
jgi:DNA-binding LytR/AlgR family response regulator